jgi:hypothetical protein
MGCFPRSIAPILVAIRLLALAKFSNGIKPIISGEVFYWLISKALYFQFQNAFSSHLQFGVAVSDKCEMMVHNIEVILNIYLD